MDDVPSNLDEGADLPELPNKLVEDLAAVYQSPESVPARVDDAILNRARAELAGVGRRPGRQALRWVGAAAALAACLLIVARYANLGPLSPNDIDGNRRVDIVDALKLAHQVQVGAGRDINGDGVVDQRDVDAIAMNVVQLSASGGVQ